MKQIIKVGDTVTLAGLPSTQARGLYFEGPGIVLDVIEMEDGFPMFEVMFGCSIEWFEDFDLKLEKEDAG